MKPRLVVIAGPNGSGKTTWAMEYLNAYSHPYVSADAIAETMDAKTIEAVRLRAGRAFIKEVRLHIDDGSSLVAESTLSGLTFRAIMERARERGYEVSVVFVFLSSERACVARIHERVRRGGHRVPVDDIRRRFSRSINNFWTIYRHLADRWHLFYNGTSQFHEVALGEGDTMDIRDEALFALFKRLTEEATR